jgi:hypothetical protein
VKGWWSISRVRCLGWTADCNLEGWRSCGYDDEMILRYLEDIVSIMMSIVNDAEI